MIVLTSIYPQKNPRYLFAIYGLDLPWENSQVGRGRIACSIFQLRKAYPKLLLLCSSSSERWQFQVCCPYLPQDLPAKRWHTCLVMTNCLITSLAMCNTLYLLLSSKQKKTKNTSITLRKKVYCYHKFLIKKWSRFKFNHTSSKSNIKFKTTNYKEPLHSHLALIN